MYRTGLIGLGVITEHYAQGLAASAQFELVATCDLDPSAPMRPLYGSVPFFTDYAEMLASCALDFVIVATPPATHVSIAEYALRHGVSVLVEKPAVTRYEDFERLARLAARKHLCYRVMFHWQTGEEILQSQKMRFNRPIRGLRVNIFDRYSEDGVSIRKDRIPLAGTWLDSGVNALSMLSVLLPFQRVQIKGATAQRCKTSGLPIASKVLLEIDGVTTMINVDWTKDRSDKFTDVWLVDGAHYRIEHTAQSLVHLEGEEGAETPVTLWSYDGGMERLDRHYYNWFTRFDASNDYVTTKHIHKLLFEVEQRL